MSSNQSTTEEPAIFDQQQNVDQPIVQENNNDNAYPSIVNDVLAATNYYDALQIHNQASPRDIKVAYNRLAYNLQGEFTIPGCELAEQIIRRAAVILLDPLLRQAYDERDAYLQHYDLLSLYFPQISGRTEESVLTRNGMTRVTPFLSIFEFCHGGRMLMNFSTLSSIPPLLSDANASNLMYAHPE